MKRRNVFFILDVYVSTFKRRRAVDEIKRLHRELQELSVHLETLHNEERKSAAREIHDEVGAALSPQNGFLPVGRLQS